MEAERRDAELMLTTPPPSPKSYGVGALFAALTRPLLASTHAASAKVASAGGGHRSVSVVANPMGGSRSRVNSGEKEAATKVGRKRVSSLLIKAPKVVQSWKESIFAIKGSFALILKVIKPDWHVLMMWLKPCL